MATSALKLRAARHSLLYRRIPEQPSYVLSDCLLVTQKTILNHDCTNNKRITNVLSAHSSDDKKEDERCQSQSKTVASPNKQTRWNNLRQKRLMKSNVNQTHKTTSPSKQSPRTDDDHNECSLLQRPVINVQIKKKPVEFDSSPRPQAQRPLRTTPRTPTLPEDYNEEIVSQSQERNSNTVNNSSTKIFKEKSAQIRRSLSTKNEKELMIASEASSYWKIKDDRKTKISRTQTSIDVKRKTNIKSDSATLDAHKMEALVWKQNEATNKMDDIWETSSHNVKIHKERRELKRSKTSTGYYQDRKEPLPVRTTKSARPQRCATAPLNPNDQPPLTDSDCRTTCLKLEEYLYNDNLPKFQEIFLPHSPKDKKKLADFKDSKSIANIFFRACGLAKMSFVKFLLENCNPDLELKGPFFLLDDHTQYLVTPLWQAAASGCLLLLRILHEHGADINAVSDTGSSPLLAACYMSHVEVATYLLSNKAAVNVCNAKGLTCLMNAVHNVDLVRVLVLNGAEINRADHRGNTSMHFAVEEGRVKTVKILFELGGNPLLHNKEGFNAIQSAAKYRHKDVMEYLVQVSRVKVVDIIKVYEMIGAMVIMMDDDLDEGFVYLHKATTLRYMNKSQVILKRLKSSLLTEHENETEFTNVQQLAKIASDPTRLRIQALMIYERQWGSSHDNFLQLLLYCGATFADHLNFREAGKLWRLSYQLHFEKYIGRSEFCDPFNGNVLKSLGFVMKLLFQWKKVLNSRRNIERNEEPTAEIDDKSIDDRYQISETNVRRVLCLLCQHCVAANKWINVQVPVLKEKYKEPLHLLLRSAICVLLIYVESFSRDERGEDVWQYVHHLISLNLRGDQHETLLHMCLNPQTLTKLELDITDTAITWPSVTMTNIMLILGSNPTDSNKDGNTALHLAAMLHKRQILSHDDGIIQSLLSKGAHADQVNNFGQTAYDLLDSKDVAKYNNTWQRSVSLKCLSARVITAYGIEYIGEVPLTLYSFIELHRSVHIKQK